MAKTDRQSNQDQLGISPGTAMRFSDILAAPGIRSRWDRVRRYFFLRESTYDMTNRCNIRCNGCYYYSGEKQFADEINDPELWRQLMRKEKERGITYAVLAGAEPSLVPHLCQVCHETIPLGAIATNGIKFIPESVRYKIHISVWGTDATSRAIRNAPNMLKRQIGNYENDPRAVFVYTFNRHNINEAFTVAEHIARHNCRLTFNMFSAPEGYTGDLRHTPETLAQTAQAMLALMHNFPQHILYSTYNVVAHTHSHSLHDLFGCSYPRMNPSRDVGLGRSFRQYRTDLTWDRAAACCVPDTDCKDCRHYASGSAVVTARLFRHANHLETFKAWLDYVDTYLAVWVMDYKKNKNLTETLETPPGKPGLDLPRSH
jgi:MoaA/NifB/PqqE/SkfB family radical SAM enzyme